MGVTKTTSTPYRRFQDPEGIVFIPWEDASTLSSDGYDIHDIVGDTVSLTQDDAERTEVPHEFSDDPLDENVSLGNKNLTMQCLDFQDVILKNLFGFDTNTKGFSAAPSGYKDLWCAVLLRFSGKSVVMPRVKMDSKTTLENMRSDIARGELSGVLYSTDVTLGIAEGSAVVNTPFLIVDHTVTGGDAENPTLTANAMKIGGKTITFATVESGAIKSEEPSIS